MRIFVCLLAALSCAAANTSFANSWIFLPSTYSHDPATGQRVTQFAPIEPVFVLQRPDFQRSGLRQLRSVIRAGRSLDVYNVVEQYGDNIRPYGEWLYPYRPYAAPYDAWGPPFGGVNGEFQRDTFRRGDPRGRFDHRFRDPRFPNPVPLDGGIRGGGYVDPRRPIDRRFDDGRLDARTRTNERFNGLYDSREIPGDDEHYREVPSTLDRMDDREFFRRGGR